MPDVANIDYNGIPVIVHGVADKHTIHIKNFVMAQKKKKPSRVTRVVPNRYNSSNRSNGSFTFPRARQGATGYMNNGLPHQPFNQIHNTTTNLWYTSNIPIVQIPQSYTTISYAPPAVIDYTFQNFNPQNPNGINPPLSSKTVASFPPKSIPTPTPQQATSGQPILSDLMSVQVTPTMDDNSSVMDDDLNCVEDDEIAAFDVQRAMEHGESIVLLRKRIRQLLLKYPKGLWLSSVQKLYNKLFNCDLNLEDYKLKNRMALFDSVSDFVDSQRDRLPNSTDRILLLKPAYVEAVKREQLIPEKIESNTSPSSLKDYQQTNYTDEHSLRPITNTIDQPIVDLSSFVPLDFHYKRIDYTSNELFEGFLGDVEDPWNIHIVNVQFISKRDRMMTQLQEHYTQSSSQSIYIIPFEQLEMNLSCVYHHYDNQYYRSFIMQIDTTHNSDIIILKIYLVDFGLIISDISYHTDSADLKFLHKNFSSLSTQVYDCRLANIHHPGIDTQWSDDVRQFIKNSCSEQKFPVEIIGRMDTVYCINLWLDQNQRQSMNELLILQGFAVECHDSHYSEFQSFSSPRSISNVNNNSSRIDEQRFPSTNDQIHMEYNPNENNIKYFDISIDHAYYFVKHPFTKRPCLPCFEVARLLNKDETYVSQLNLIRETELPFSESYQTLFHELQRLSESSKCPHINRETDNATIRLYDLSSIRDYLIGIKFQEGDVIDAFRQEYDDYERPGYWNEEKNSYINKENFELNQKDLYQRRDLLNFRRTQLVSLSKTHQTVSSQNEMQDIDRELNNLHEKIHIKEPILSSMINDDSNAILRSASSLSSNVKISNKKMRETRFRIARPFDQQFSLNTCFNHQLILDDTMIDDEIEERLQDLHRITKNIIHYLTLESDISDEHHRGLFNQAIHQSPDLIDQQIPLDKRIDIYNYCFQFIEYCQPIIQSYVQRTNLLDTIY
ncbi:hypothetical protein I4U23_018500 [Adineta vaga]|nr:hypothetical protein I4U23_018500 [Adineta vaga]